MSEQLESVNKAFRHALIAYFHLNDEIKRKQYAVSEGENYDHLYKCMIVMDDIFAEEIEPVFQFIIDNFKEGSEIMERHVDIKKRIADGK